jgi:hypothetical protein
MSLFENKQVIRLAQEITFRQEWSAVYEKKFNIWTTKCYVHSALASSGEQETNQMVCGLPSYSWSTASFIGRGTSQTSSREKTTARLASQRIEIDET